MISADGAADFWDSFPALSAVSVAFVVWDLWERHQRSEIDWGVLAPAHRTARLHGRALLSFARCAADTGTMNALVSTQGGADRRLAALRSLVQLARLLGLVPWRLSVPWG